jgi:hypothetical protein
MIDCPICHVKNADDARFCAECGQRLTGPSKSGSSAPANPADAAGEPPVQPGHSAPRLRSPLLSGDIDDGLPTEQAHSQGHNIDRLKQMSSRPRPETAAGQPDLPARNPFDPRPLSSSNDQQSAAQRPRLRSPLLGHDDDDESQSAPPSGQMSAAEEDDQAHSGGGLRSPLLGGPYGGPERRHSTGGGHNASFGGQERRRGLHSPILGNAYDEQADYVAQEEEAPADEDDPNILRSPLLAAKRPVTDRPSVNPPAASNLQTPLRPSNAPETMQPAHKPAPTASYTNLRRLSAAASAADSAATPPAPSSAPPGSGPQSNAGAAALSQPAVQGQTAPPPQQQPASEQAMLMRFAADVTIDRPIGSFAQPSSAQPSSAADAHPFARSDSPQPVPAAFQNVQRSSAIPSGKAEPAKPASPPPATTSGITVQGPESNKTNLQGAALVGSPPASLSRQAEALRSSPSLSRFAAESHDEANNSTFDNAYISAGESSPVSTILAAILAVAALAKLWVVISVFSSDWRNYSFLVIDQIIGLAVIISLLLLCLSRKK